MILKYLRHSWAIVRIISPLYFMIAPSPVVALKHPDVYSTASAHSNVVETSIPKRVLSCGRVLTSGGSDVGD
jgi:S-formylglutathione hydrolase FrmB